MKISKYLAIGVATILLVPMAAVAATFVGDEVYSISKDEVVAGDVYAGSANMSIAGTVQGDLTAGASSLVLTGRITQDLNIGAGTIHVLGSIGDDARIAGGDVTIGGNINGDLIAFGGIVKVLPDVVIAGDVFIAGGVVQFDGVAQRGIDIRGGEIMIGGSVLGGVYVEADKLTITENATLNSGLTYKSPKEAEIKEGADIRGEINYEPRGAATDKTGFMAIMGMLALSKLVMMLVAGIILVLVFKRFTDEIIESALTKFGKELIRGFIVLVVVPVAIIILLISFLGIPFAVMAGLLYGFLLILGSIYAGIVLGGVLNKYVFKSKIESRWQNAFLGIVILQLIVFIPFIGWLIKFVFCLMALGAIAGIAYRSLWLRR